MKHYKYYKILLLISFLCFGMGIGRTQIFYKDYYFTEKRIYIDPYGETYPKTDKEAECYCRIEFTPIKYDSLTDKSKDGQITIFRKGQKPFVLNYSEYETDYKTEEVTYFFYNGKSDKCICLAKFKHNKVILQDLMIFNPDKSTVLYTNWHSD